MKVKVKVLRPWECIGLFTDFLTFKRSSLLGKHKIWLGPGGYSHILAIRVFATGKDMVFKPFSMV